MAQSAQLSESFFLKCRDYTVSGEEFELRHDGNLDMLVTFPQPGPETLGGYYESEEYISHTDSRSSLFDKVYQGVRTFMIDRKLNWIEKHKTKGDLLDIGAGTGDFLLRAKSRSWKVSGVEPNSAARIRALEKGVELLPDTKGLAPDSFDVITLWHVLEHVPDLEAQISELKRLLKKDGILVVAVPNFKSYDAKRYKEHWAAYDVPRHLWHFSRDSIKSIFNRFGFDVVKQEPLKFDAYYVSLLSEKYKSGSKRPFSAFLTGFLSNLKARRSGEYSSLAYFLRKS